MTASEKKVYDLMNNITLDKEGANLYIVNIQNGKKIKFSDIWDYHAITMYMIENEKYKISKLELMSIIKPIKKALKVWA